MKRINSGTIWHTWNLNLLFLIIIWGRRTRWSARPSGSGSGWASVVLVIFFPLLNRQTEQKINDMRVWIRIKRETVDWSFFYRKLINDEPILCKMSRNIIQFSYAKNKGLQKIQTKLPTSSSPAYVMLTVSHNKQRNSTTLSGSLLSQGERIKSWSYDVKIMGFFFHMKSTVVPSVSWYRPGLVILFGPLGCCGGGGGGGGGESWPCPCERSAVPYTATVRQVYQPRSTRPSVLTCMWGCLKHSGIKTLKLRVILFCVV